MVRILCSYEKIIAKSNGTSLKKHTFDSVEVLDILLKSDMELLKNKTNLLNINLEIFLSDLKKATFFHDFGKSSDIWQSKAKEKNRSLPPHAVYSGFFSLLIKKI